MKVIFSDNTEVDVILVTGETKYIQGANRDTLTFIFDDSHALDELDALFTEDKCEKITLVEGESLDTESNVISDNQSIHKWYTIRAGLEKVSERTDEKTEYGDYVYVNRIKVSMSQRTYEENQLKQLQEEMTYAQIAIVELYEGGLV